MEIEIRAKINNIKEKEKIIINLGAKLNKKKYQVDKYFGSVDLFKKVGYSFLLRVRNEGDKKFLTYKGDKFKKDGVWQEYEFEIKNEKEAETMLKEMGLDNIIEVFKKRIEYHFDSLTICLDEIKDLGSFIEIESQVDSDENKEKLEKLMKLLGIEKNQIIHKGYVTMLLDKNKSLYRKYIIH